jgi:tetratricopeptide (TPR) repeat protein
MVKAVDQLARSGLTALAMLGAAAPLPADDAFFRAAIVASGTQDGCEVAQWQSVYAELRGMAVTEEILALPAAERLAAIQRGLHSQILIGDYQPAASDLRQALSRGDFNCLSAAALYFDLCRSAGMELEIWSRPGHVWLRTQDGVTIEPASAPALRLRVSSGTPSLVLQASLARRITPQQLLGKFYYNRGAQLLAQEQYPAGLELLRTALRLDPHDGDARENLLAGLNNWAAEHLRARRYGEAARLIRQGLSIEPAYEPLVANQRLLRVSQSPQ